MVTNREHIKKYKQVNVGEVSLPVCFDKAKGSYLFDTEGNSYLDFTSGYGVTSSGWLREEITNAIQQQLLRAAYAPPWLPTREAIDLSELLINITPASLVQCARATGGADANEIIFKAIYAATGKKGIISFRRSYHGGTHFTLNISDAECFHLPKLPVGAEFHLMDSPYCYRCPHGKTPDSCNLECTKSIEELMKKEKDIGSFFLEPVIGSGGVIIPPLKYLARIKELCKHYNVFLVADEVLTGFGRLGSLTACDLFKIEPDALSFAKGMGAGYIGIGAAVLNEELSCAIKKYEDVSSTFAWTPLACCIAKTNIELIIKEKLDEQAKNNGNFLIHETALLFQKYLPEKTGEIRGLGLMIGIEMVEDSDSKIPDKRIVQKFVIAALRQGLMVCASWDFQTLIMMPPLNTSKKELKEGLNKIEDVLKQVSR